MQAHLLIHGVGFMSSSLRQFRAWGLRGLDGFGSEVQLEGPQIKSKLLQTALIFFCLNFCVPHNKRWFRNPVQGAWSLRDTARALRDEWLLHYRACSSTVALTFP